MDKLNNIRRPRTETLVCLFLLAFFPLNAKCKLQVQYRTLYACEGSYLNITCERGTHIDLIRANFGRYSISICNDNGNLDWSVNCMSKSSFRVIQESCGNRPNCNLHSSTDIFGDPCPGTLKYLEAHYQCIAGINVESTGRIPPTPKISRGKTNVPLITDGSNPLNSQPDSAPRLIPILHSTQEPNGFVVGLSPQSNHEVSNEDEISEETSEKVLFPTVLTTKTSTDVSDTNIYVRHPYPRNITKAVDFSTSAAGNEEKLGKTDSRSETTSSPLKENDHINRDHEIFVDSEVTISENRSNDFMPSNITHCQPRVSRSLSWNWTKVGKDVLQNCPPGAKGTARWLCGQTNGVPQWIPTEADFYGCNSNWVQTFEERINMGDLSVVTLANELALSTRTKPLYGGDLHRIPEIIYQLVYRLEGKLEDLEDDRQKNQFVKELLWAVQDSCSNLLEIYQRHSWLDLPPIERKGAANSLISSLERNAFLLAETMQTPEVVEKECSNIYLSIHMVNSEIVHTQESIYLNYTTGSSIEMPTQSLLAFSKNDYVRFAFIVYKNMAKVLELQSENEMDEMLQDGSGDSPEVQINLEVIQKCRNAIINSDMIGLIFSKDLKHTPLDEKVSITLQHILTTNITNPRCVYWDTDRQIWSQLGCSIISSNKTHTTCQCEHLTNFAVLMEVSDIPMSYSNEVALGVITYFGCIVSIVCLTMALITFSAFKSLKSDRTTIHKNLCFCLLNGELIFILGIGQTWDRLLCGLVAVLLHYFFLAAFCWMFFEGFQLYAMLIEVFETEKSRVGWYYMISYGFPAAIVAISASIDWSSYGTLKHCWLRADNYFVMSFVGPVVAILIANLVFLTIALYVMCGHMPAIRGAKSKEETKLTSLKIWLRGALTLVFLLGLTWTFGLLYLNEETIVMAYIFTTLNSLQGLFIFIFHCLQNEKVRKEYSTTLSRIHWKPFCVETTKTIEASDPPVGIMNGDKKTSPFFQSSGVTISTSGGSNNQITPSAPVMVNTTGTNCSTATIRRVTTPGPKYYITGQQNIKAGQLEESGYFSRHSPHDMVTDTGQQTRQRPVACGSVVEHVYECIDEDPYIAKVLLPNSCRNIMDGYHMRSHSDLSNKPLISSVSTRNTVLSTQQNYSTSLQHGVMLPAIISDNTKTTIIPNSPPRRNQTPRQHNQIFQNYSPHEIVAVLDGKTVTTVIQSDDSTSSSPLIEQIANSDRNSGSGRASPAKKSANKGFKFPMSTNCHLSSDC